MKKRTWLAASAIPLIAGAAALGLNVLPGSAAPNPTAPSTNDASPNLPRRAFLPLSVARALADTALNTCHNKGIPVSVAVVDPDGVLIELLRADGATGATVAVAEGKAHAAAGFQSPTSGLQDAAKTQPGLISVPDFVILPGGEPIRSGTALLGGVGVSGAPTGEIDDSCAQAGLKVIAGQL
jgi:uncharacterized protein GlcG (DUF336 family)